MGYPQQPYGQPPYPSPGGHPVAPSAGPAVAMIAAVFGMIATIAFVVLVVDRLSHLGEQSFLDLNTEAQVVVAAQILCPVVLLIGALLVFTGNLPGAVLLAIGGGLGLCTVLLLPPLLVDISAIGDYLSGVFEFDGAQGTFATVAMFASTLALLFAVLPPTFRHLRGAKTANLQNQGW